MSTITYDAEAQRISVGEWTRRATWIRRTDTSTPLRWSALMGVRRSVNLLVEGNQGDSSISIEAWVGEPEESDGLAVMVADGALTGTSPIPLCGCGDRGCGNVTVQLFQHITVDCLPHLFEILGGLDDVDVRPTYGHTWLGGFRNGEPFVDIG